MTVIRLRSKLPLISVTIRANNKEREIKDVLLDTGSAGTLFRTTDLEEMGVFLEGTDEIVAMAGIGGREYVAQKQIEEVRVGNLTVSPFIIQLGALDYNLRLNAYLGLISYLPLVHRSIFAT